MGLRIAVSSEPHVAATSVRLLIAAEAATLLSISRRKLWELTNRGLIAHVRIGRSVRYDPADLNAWVAARKSGGSDG